MRVGVNRMREDPPAGPLFSVHGPQDSHIFGIRNAVFFRFHWSHLLAALNMLGPVAARIRTFYPFS